MPAPENPSGRRWIGRWILAVGIVHTLIAIGTYIQPVAAIVLEGFWNTVDDVPGRPLAFWLICASLLIVLLGALTSWIEKRTASPRFLGWALLALCVGAIVVKPYSGFWLLLPPAAAIVMRR